MAKILTDYVTALRKNPRDFADGTFPTDFDFKYGNTADDLFQVGNQWLRADQFGNYAAGYAGTVLGGDLGYAAVAGAGIWWASRKGSGEHWFDGASRPMINAGASQAWKEKHSLFMRSEYRINNGTFFARNPAGCK